VTASTREFWVWNKTEIKAEREAAVVIEENLNAPRLCLTYQYIEQQRLILHPLCTGSELPVPLCNTFWLIEISISLVPGTSHPSPGFSHSACNCRQHLSSTPSRRPPFRIPPLQKTLWQGTPGVLGRAWCALLLGRFPRCVIYHIF